MICVALCVWFFFIFYFCCTIFSYSKAISLCFEDVVHSGLKEKRTNVIETQTRMISHECGNYLGLAGSCHNMLKAKLGNVLPPLVKRKTCQDVVAALPGVPDTGNLFHQHH